jgi:hypothetical protein
MGEGAIVRNCRQIGRMGKICKVGVIDYLVSSFCRGDRESVGEEREERKIRTGKEEKEERKTT